ncbi:MAG: LysR family transcriptional regulator [Sphingomonadaceae bacterium]|nr:LysR family transcriptional regulator [Sphingomonadaceae bacterium]
MRLRQIEIFYHVYRTGSISGAARELLVSQPSVSKVLRHLEDQLGFALFLREKGRLLATDEAHELFGDVERIYDMIGLLRNSAEHIKHRRGGHLNLGTLPSLGLNLAPRVIANLREAEPDFSFGITTLHSGELVSTLIEKRCDICLGFPVEHDDRITSVPLTMIDLLLVSPPELDEFGDDTISLSDLDGVPFVGIKDTGPAGVLLSEAMSRAGVVPQVVVTAHTYHVAMSLVAMGQGMAVVDQFSAEAEEYRGLHCARFSPALQMQVCAYFLPDNKKMDLIESFLAEAVNVAGDTAGRSGATMSRKV